MGNNVESLNITMSADALSGWNYLLQKGFSLIGESGMSVRHFLREVLGFGDDFIETTVRTIFLNNRPVDDLDATRIKAGDRMALGSAMPGLVGIVMGRDNPFKSFRSDISAVTGGAGASPVQIELGMKIFSTLAVDTGRMVLGRGIRIDAAQLATFLADKRDRILEADGADAGTLLARLGTMSGPVSIRVEFR